MVPHAGAGLEPVVVLVCHVFQKWQTMMNTQIESSSNPMINKLIFLRKTCSCGQSFSWFRLPSLRSYTFRPEIAEIKKPWTDDGPISPIGPVSGSQFLSYLPPSQCQLCIFSWHDQCMLYNTHACMSCVLVLFLNCLFRSINIIIVSGAFGNIYI